MFKLITKIALIFIFATTASACGYAYYSHANPFDYFHFNPKPQPEPPQNKKIELKIDSTCHYFQDGHDVGCFDASGRPFGTWNATKDLTSEKFFNFPDLKPGDSGEDTISIHLSGDDACGRIEINNLKDFGNTCTEPETHTNDPDCKGKTPGAKEPNGELRENLEYFAWVDQGRTPGFQGTSDPGEGDNIFNEKDFKIFDWQTFKNCPKAIALKNQMQKDRDFFKKQCDNADPDGQGFSKNKDKSCQGIPRDGHFMKDITYYIGLAWRLPTSVGNEVQSDGISFDVKFIGGAKERCGDHEYSCGQCKDGCDECDNKQCPR